jgi:steroid 5-alpha reductase family enzyme
VDKHIRKIFSVFVLGMMALFVMRLSAGEWTAINWIMMAFAAVSCVLVFVSFVYIFNFSYALACMLNGALIAVLMPSASGLILGALMFAYGVRLFSFTLKRVRSESYQVRVEHIRNEDAKLPFPVKIALLVQCTFMYTFHLFAVYTAAQILIVDYWIIVGAAVILGGIILEGWADETKQKAKAAARDSLVTTGIFSRWRHPNYSGEIVVQTGLIIVGIGAVSGGLFNYAAVIIAPLYVILLMIAESGRGDRSQAQRFGDSEEYRQYFAASGALIPRF